MIQKEQNKDWINQGRKNTVNLAIWTGIWVISMAVAAFGPIFIWNENTIISTVAIIINFMLGIGMIMANIRHLKGQDEMQQRIQLESMALALGIGVVGGLSYSLLDSSNVMAGDAEISVLVIIISLSYMTSLLYKTWQYK